MGVAKYMYHGYIVMQFEVRNMLQDVVIKDVRVSLKVKGAPLQIVEETKTGSISHGEVGYAYTIMTYDAEHYAFPVTALEAKMDFTATEIDPASKTEQGSYPDEYALPDVMLSAKDYVQGRPMKSSEFK